MPTSRRNFLTAILASPLARLFGKSKIGQRPDPNAGYVVGIDPGFHVKTVLTYWNNMPPMLNFHDTHAKYMEACKRGEYRMSGSTFMDWAKK